MCVLYLSKTSKAFHRRLINDNESFGVDATSKETSSIQWKSFLDLLDHYVQE